MYTYHEAIKYTQEPDIEGKHGYATYNNNIFNKKDVVELLELLIAEIKEEKVTSVYIDVAYNENNKV